MLGPSVQCTWRSTRCSISKGQSPVRVNWRSSRQRMERGGERRDLERTASWLGTRSRPCSKLPEVKLYQPLAYLELSRKKPGQCPSCIARDGPQEPQDTDPTETENPVKGSEPSQVANGTTPNRGRVEDGRKHSSAGPIGGRWRGGGPRAC